MATDPVVLVTGCAGFIGSAVVRALLRDAPGARVIGYDSLTPQSTLTTLADVLDRPAMSFHRGDVRDRAALTDVVRGEGVTHVLHLAAESHNDRALLDPTRFFDTNVMGTTTVLDVARVEGVQRVVDVSTIEVYGVLEGDGLFCEDSPLDARTPYAASKAAADLAARAYARSYPDLEVVITHAANNMGPYQFPEKFVPTCIIKALSGEPIPLYGDGAYARDWVDVDDHARALVQAALQPGLVTAGEPLLLDFSARELHENRTIAEMVLRALGRDPADPRALTRVADRPNHDRRYGIDPSRAERLLGFRPSGSFEDLVARTVAWYVARRDWWEPLVARGAVWVDWSRARVPGRSGGAR